MVEQPLCLGWHLRAIAVDAEDPAWGPLVDRKVLGGGCHRRHQLRTRRASSDQRNALAGVGVTVVPMRRVPDFALIGFDARNVGSWRR